MKDLYAVLGVARSATDDDIKRAYRRLASQHHPDKGGDKERFQEIQQAYSVLSDRTQREQYDNPRPQFAHHAPHFNFDNIFEMFGARFSPEGFHQQKQARIQLWITLEDAAQGGARMVSLATNRGHNTVEITIPAGIQDGTHVRYNNIGPNNSDIVVLFRIKPNERWLRSGLDLSTEISINIWDLILGSNLVIATITGTTVEVTVPPNTQPGTQLKVRGHGMPDPQTRQRGDMLIRVQARLPQQISQNLIECIRRERDQ